MIISVVVERYVITRRHCLQCLARKTRVRARTHTQTRARARINACPRESAVQPASQLNSVPLLASTDNWHDKMISVI